MGQSTFRSLFRAAGPPCLLFWAVLAGVSPAHAGARQSVAEQTDAVLYRVFLRDGGMLVSYGEFAHMGDRVVLSIPIGGTNSSPVLHLVTIQSADVDWDRTNSYAQAARSRRYADTRGEIDYGKLTRDVADALFQAGSVADPARRLALAEAARNQLVEWPQQHFGYRAEEIAQMSAWLDQVVSELRVAAGQSRFELTLVASTPAAAPPVQLLPSPDFRERVDSALVAARKTADSAERISLLRAVMDSLQPVAPAGSWMASLHADVSAQLDVELKTDRAYADLTKQTLTRASWYADRADVRGLESLVRSVLEADTRLQRARPTDVAGLLAALDARIDGARRLRLAHDAWVLRTALLRTYWQEIRQGMDRLLGVRIWLTDVRQLAGPSPDALRRLAFDAEYAGHQIAKVKPPAEVASAHSTLGSASRMAVRAAKARLDALRSGSMEGAWEASSAAAGALLLLDQSVLELRKITREPSPLRTR